MLSLIVGHSRVVYKSRLDVTPLKILKDSFRVKLINVIYMLNKKLKEYLVASENRMFQHANVSSSPGMHFFQIENFQNFSSYHYDKG